MSHPDRLKYFLTPSKKIVHMLDYSDEPTAQGQGAALVQGDFDSRPHWIEYCNLIQPGFDKYPYHLDHRFNKN